MKVMNVFLIGTVLPCKSPLEKLARKSSGKACKARTTGFKAQSARERVWGHVRPFAPREKVISFLNRKEG